MKKKISLILTFFLIISLLTACRKEIESIPYEEESIISSGEIIDFFNPDGTLYSDTTLISELELPVETEYTSENMLVSESISQTSETTTKPVTQETTIVTTTEETTTTTTVATTTAVPITTTVATTTTIPQATYNPSDYTPLNYGNQIGMWISFLEFQNILKGKSESQFRKSVCEMYDNCVSMGINTVYVHARSHGDAFYDSDLYPWSKNITGEIGAKPSFDPYEILVEEAHKRGLSFHAWINPMRTVTEDDMKKISDSYQIKKWAKNKNGTYIVNVNGTYWLNPAYKEVRQLIVNGAQEIISKYNVDGIHIDDYFYQSSFTNSFDKSAFSSSGYSDLKSFRVNNINLMVKEIYSGVKNINPSVLFGISPAGNIDNLYAYHCADVKTWCSKNGYCDYIIPQIYWGFTHKSAAYDKMLGQWCSIHTNKNVKLVVGLAAYRAADGEMENEPQVLSKQISYFKNQYPSHYGGAAFFRYENLFKPSSAQKSKIQSELEALESQLE